MFKFNGSDINKSDVYNYILIRLTLQYNLNIDIYKYLRKFVDIEINYKRNIKHFHSLFKKNGAGVIDCRVDESYVKKLLGYFKLRA